MQSLIGKWQLIEARAFDEAGNETPSPFGPSPMGIMLFEAERMIGLLADGRVVMPELAKRAFFSYTGEYQFNGEKLAWTDRGSRRPRHRVDGR